MKTSFRVRKRIFATYDSKERQACIKLSEISQDVFSSTDRAIIYPVSNKWGKKGWTVIEMEKVDKDLFSDALKAAYCEVAPGKLANRIRSIDSDK